MMVPFTNVADCVCPTHTLLVFSISHTFCPPLPLPTSLSIATPNPWGRATIDYKALALSIIAAPIPTYCLHTRKYTTCLHATNKWHNNNKPNQLTPNRT